VILANIQPIGLENTEGVKSSVHYFLEYNEISGEFRLKEEFNLSGKDTIQDLNRNEAKEWYDKLPNKIIPFPR
jgi:hypothetical protein